MARKSVASITIYDQTDPIEIAEGEVYYTTAVYNNPGTPSASDYNFTTGAFTGLTSGWSRVAPTVEIMASDASYYSARYRATREPGDPTATVTFQTPRQDIIVGNVISRGIQVFTPRTVTDITTGPNATITVSAGETSGLGNGDQVDVQNASVEGYNKTYTVTGTSGNNITTSTSTSGLANFTGNAELAGDNITPNLDNGTASGKGAFINNTGDLFIGNADGNYLQFEQDSGEFTIEGKFIASDNLTVSANRDDIYSSLPTSTTSGTAVSDATGMYFNSVHNRIEIWDSGELKMVVGGLEYIPENA